MRRLLVLTTLLGVGALSMAMFAQAPAAEPAANVLAAMKIERVKENLYVVTGSGPGDTFSGGNTAVFVTDSGITLVDTKLPGFGQALLDRIRTVSDKPVTRIINTHAHADHTANNRFFGANVETIVHQNADATMKNARNLSPRTTYGDKLTIGSGRDEIDLYYFGRGHTDGDAFVVFPALRAMHVGDMFPWKALPYIDAGIGGSAIEQPKSLAAAVATVRNVDTIINGHAPLSTWDDLREYADFVQDFVAYAERALKSGKSVVEAAEEYRVPARFKRYSATAAPNLSVQGNIQLAYNELAKR